MLAHERQPQRMMHGCDASCGRDGFAQRAFGSDLVVLLLTFYLVTDGPRIHSYLLSFVPAGQREHARRLTSAMGQRMGGWLLGQLVVSTVVGVITSARCAVIHQRVSIPIGTW